MCNLHIRNEMELLDNMGLLRAMLLITLIILIQPFEEVLSHEVSYNRSRDVHLESLHDENVIQIICSWQRCYRYSIGEESYSIRK